MRATRAVALLLTLASPVVAASAGPLKPFNYYVGKWSCLEGTIGRSTHRSTWTFRMEDGLLFESIVIPRQGDVSTPYVDNAIFAYDAKKDRYVETEMDNSSIWYVSIAKLGSSSTIHWRDIASSAQRGRWDMIPVGVNKFILNSYPGMTAAKPNYRAVCGRVSSS